MLKQHGTARIGAATRRPNRIERGMGRWLRGMGWRSSEIVEGMGRGSERRGRGAALLAGYGEGEGEEGQRRTGKD